MWSMPVATITWGSELIRARVDDPAFIVPLDPLDACAQAQLHPLLAGMAFDVLDHLVAAGEGRRALEVGTSGQVGEAAPGVEPQAVVARAPRRGDPVGLVEDHRRHPASLRARAEAMPAIPAPTTTT